MQWLAGGLILGVGLWMIVRPQSFFRKYHDSGTNAYLMRAYQEAGKAILSVTAFCFAARLIGEWLRTVQWM
jgi:hypothetical protein